MELIDQLMHATAWPMEEPAAYGAFHLGFFLIGLAVSILIAWKLRNLSDRGNRWLLFSFGFFLAICEVYKQLFFYFYMEDHSYPWWIFPFQLCDMPMYLCLIVPWLKPGKLRQSLYSFMMLYNLLGGFIAFLEPSGITYGYWTLTLHAFIWHMSLVFMGLYLIFSHRGGHTREHFKLSTYVFLVLCLVAFSINMGLWDISGGAVNNFFLGPKITSLIVFHQIAKSFGWYVSTLLYIPVVILGAFLIHLPIHMWAKKKLAQKA